MYKAFKRLVNNFTINKANKKHHSKKKQRRLLLDLVSILTKIRQADSKITWNQRLFNLVDYTWCL